MFEVLAILHDYADKLEDVYHRSDLADELDKIASEILARYHFRIKRPRKSKGTFKTKRKVYYKMHRQHLRNRMRKYRTLNRTHLKRRRGLKHYHRFG